MLYEHLYDVRRIPRKFEDPRSAIFELFPSSMRSYLGDNSIIRIIQPSNAAILNFLSCAQKIEISEIPMQFPKDFIYPNNNCLEKRLQLKISPSLPGILLDYY